MHNDSGFQAKLGDPITRASFPPIPQRWLSHRNALRSLRVTVCTAHSAVPASLGMLGEAGTLALPLRWVTSLLEVTWLPLLAQVELFGDALLCPLSSHRSA